MLSVHAVLVHLSFNVIGTAVWLTVFCIVKAIAVPTILKESASLMGIAVIHSVFNILCTALMIPFAGELEKLVKKMIPDYEDKHYLPRKTNLENRLSKTYDKIEEAENALVEAKSKKRTILAEKI